MQEPAVFVGNSIGALLSLMMLANHPDLARGGILLNATAGLNHRPDELTLPLRVVMGTLGSNIFPYMIRLQKIWVALSLYRQSSRLPPLYSLQRLFDNNFSGLPILVGLPVLAHHYLA